MKVGCVESDGDTELGKHPVCKVGLSKPPCVESTSAFKRRRLKRSILSWLYKARKPAVGKPSLPGEFRSSFVGCIEQAP